MPWPCQVHSENPIKMELCQKEMPSLCRVHWVPPEMERIKKAIEIAMVKIRTIEKMIRGIEIETMAGEGGEVTEIEIGTIEITEADVVEEVDEVDGL